MDESVKDKIAKIYELVNRGGTEGEKAAAREALDRICAIMYIMVPGSFEASSRHVTRKRVVSKLKYIDWVTIECAYEYFRRHMKNEWNRVVMPQLKQCRKTKTRNKLRARLSRHFMTTYLIASKLYREEDLTTADLKGKDVADRLMMQAVEGGQYNKQVSNGLLLN